MNRILTISVMLILVVTASFGKDDHAARNKEVVRKVFIDIWTQGKYEVANEIYAKDFVNHGADKEILFEQDQASIHGWRAAFPDIELFVEKEFAEGDFVTVLWRGRGTNTGSGNGLGATGKKTDGRGISIFRVVDGKIKEEWTEYSQLLLLQQLGLYPSQHQP
jgi:predicted ester cyclase